MIIEMRRHLKTMGWFWYLIIFMFTVPPIINAIKTFRARLDCVAMVDGLPIRQKDFTRVKNGHLAYVRQLQSMGLGQFAPKITDSDIVRICAQNILEQKIADNLGVHVGDEELAKEVAQGVAKSAITSTGRVDMARYSLSLAAGAGMSVAEYEDSLRKKMRSDAVSSLIKSCAYEPKFQSEYSDKVKATKKRFNLLEVSLNAIEAEVKKSEISDNELELFFQENAASYMTKPEKALQYAEVSRSLFAEMALPEDAELEEHYERVKDSRFADPEKFSVSYVAAEFATEEEKAAAQLKLENLLQEIASSGKKLEKLAKKHGLTVESKQMFSLYRGELPDVLEQALMEKRELGATTTVLEEGNKLYVAQVDQYKPFTVKAFEDVKAEIFTEVQKLKVDELIRADIESLITEVRDSDNGTQVFDQYVSKLHLKPREVKFVQGEKLKHESSMMENLYKSAFTQNAEAGYLGYVFTDGELAVYLVTESKDPVVKPFETVAAQVKHDLIQKMAKNLQTTFVAGVREKLLTGQPIEDELARFNLKVHHSAWLTAESKELPGHKFGAKAIEQLKSIDRKQQVLKIKDEDRLFLAWLAEQEESSHAAEEKSTQESYESMGFLAKQDIFDGFVASLLKNATIESNNRTITDLIPEF